MVNLETLYLESNQITDISPLSNLVNLESLYLANNPITDISPLKNFVNLSYLQLHSTLNSQQQIDELKKALPKCKIDF